MNAIRIAPNLIHVFQVQSNCGTDTGAELWQTSIRLRFHPRTIGQSTPSFILPHAGILPACNDMMHGGMMNSFFSNPLSERVRENGNPHAA